MRALCDVLMEFGVAKDRIIVWDRRTDELKRYIVDLVAQTRRQHQIVVGGSPRASLALFASARMASGQPYLRLTVILLAVAAFTAASAIVFRQSALRRRYRL